METILDSFNKLVDSFITRYKGCLIKKEDGRYKVFRSSFATIEEAKMAIDEALENMKKPI